MTEVRKTNVESAYIMLKSERLWQHRLVPHICMILRANTGHFDGTWSFPAGRLEEYRTLAGIFQLETPVEAAIREAKEEVGVTIHPNNLTHIVSLERLAEEGDHTRIDHLFITDRWRNRAYNAEPEKCDAVRWYPTGNLPQPLAPMVEKFFEAQPQVLR